MSAWSLRKWFVLSVMMLWAGSVQAETSFNGSGQWSNSEGLKGTLVSQFYNAESDYGNEYDTVSYIINLTPDKKITLTIVTRDDDDGQCIVVSKEDPDKKIGTCTDDGEMSYTTADGEQVELSVQWQQDNNALDIYDAYASIRILIEGKITYPSQKTLNWEDTLKVDMDALVKAEREDY